MKEFTAITKALADENRLRIIMALEGRNLCVCQITELMGLAFGNKGAGKWFSRHFVDPRPLLRSKELI